MTFRRLPPYRGFCSDGLMEDKVLVLRRQLRRKHFISNMQRLEHHVLHVVLHFVPTYRIVILLILSYGFTTASICKTNVDPVYMINTHLSICQPIFDLVVRKHHLSHLLTNRQRCHYVQRTNVTRPALTVIYSIAKYVVFVGIQ